MVIEMITNIADLGVDKVHCCYKYFDVQEDFNITTGPQKLIYSWKEK